MNKRRKPDARKFELPMTVVYAFKKKRCPVQKGIELCTRTSITQRARNLHSRKHDGSLLITLGLILKDQQDTFARSSYAALNDVNTWKSTNGKHIGRAQIALTLSPCFYPSQSIKRSTMANFDGLSPDIKKKIMEIQQNYYELLPDWSEYKSGEHKYLKANIGYAFHGPPSHIPNCYDSDTSNAAVHVKEDSLHEISIKAIVKLRNYSSATYYNVWYIDDNCRIYTDWSDYITITVQASTVWIERNDSPSSKIGTKFLSNIDAAATVLTFGSAIGLTAAAFITPIGPLLTAAGIAAQVAGGSWTFGRSSQQLIDRNLHKQSIALDNSEAAAAWMGACGSAFGVAASGGTALLSKAVEKVTAEAGKITVNGVPLIDARKFVVYLIEESDLEKELNNYGNNNQRNVLAQWLKDFLLENNVNSGNVIRINDIDSLLKDENKKKATAWCGLNNIESQGNVENFSVWREDNNASGNVTKIELELEEAPDDTLLVGSIPSKLDATVEINSTYPDGIPGTGAVVVRAEEALIVVLVLVLWVAAIALFFNRWGKIRMLEPYQPKFQQQHRQSCAIVDSNPLQRPRQNSVFVGSSTSLLLPSQDTPRRAKSAFDLQSLVLLECAAQEKEEIEALKTLKPYDETAKLSQRDRRTSVYQFERMEQIPPQRERGMSVCQFDRSESTTSKAQQRERGMSFCQFDRMDVLARPLQRDRGMSICQFDRTDVLARPLQRDRGSSICHFDRMDVLARPTPCLGKSFLRERRVSVCNFLEKDEESGRGFQQDRRLSVSNVEKIETLGKSQKEQQRGSGGNMEKQEIFAKCVQRHKSGTLYHFDRPSCSKTPDVVLGYKATCV
ncbi:hypothetical protein KM043_016303 [Ampulex compressa]|nr:hypothetical protein KM043_016303 [Ampulex compressa]